MSSNNKWMFVLGVALIFLFTVSYIGNFSLSNVATDSGFDTSYDSGGSSSSSSSSDFDGSSGEPMDIFDRGDNITLGIFLSIFLLIIFKEVADKKVRIIIGLIMISIIVLALLRILFLIFFGGIIALFTVVPFILSRRSKNVKALKREYLPKTDENLKMLEEGYKIFINVQNAWMNFDYDQLREETTDNLYNTYYNQLQPLSLKGQKNVMSDFELINYELVNIKEKDNVTTVKIELEVKFYDYIADQKGNVIRGTKNKKVHMLYEMTYIYNKKAITKCPNCDADLNSSDEICSYCNTKITSIRSKMKLSTKKCLRQR